MLLFGHIGLTLSAALILNYSLRRNQSTAESEAVAITNRSAQEPGVNITAPKFWGLVKRTEGLDLRYVIIGSLLPDIIDKPIGRYFFSDTFGSGHLYAHTLLFAILLLIAGFGVDRILHKRAVILLAFAALMHLVLDLMWLEPGVFFWPLSGFALEKGVSIPFGEWLSGLISQVAQQPWEAMPELLGVAVTAWFFWGLWRQNALLSFILRGRI